MSFEHYQEEHGLDTETLLAAVRADAIQQQSQAPDAIVPTPSEPANEVDPVDEGVPTQK